MIDSYDNNNREKIFTAKMPGSRVVIEIIKELKEVINRTDFRHPDYITYKNVKRINDEYYLIRRDNSNLVPVTDYLKNNTVSSKEIINWCSKIARVYIQAEKTGYKLPVITVQSLYINQKGNIKIIAPDIVDIIIQYRDDIIAPVESIKYKAPELIKGNSRNNHTDIYSFGILMYYLLTGHSPFEGESKTVLYDKILTGSIIEPYYLNYTISEELNQVIIKLTASKQKERFQEWDTIIAKLIEIKERKLLLADGKQQQLNKKRSNKVIRVSNTKSKIRFFFRHHWKKVTFFSLIFLALILTIFTNGPKPAVTNNNTPEQVVNMFYQAINSNNISIVEDTTSIELNNLEKLITESYILTKMKKAYSINADNNQLQEKILGIKNLKIKQKQKDPLPVYTVEYIFYLKQEHGKLEQKMKDIITLNKKNNCWQIIELQGDIKKIIAGNFNSIQEGQD